jgi:hypothetical protein
VDNNPDKKIKTDTASIVENIINSAETILAENETKSKIFEQEVHDRLNAMKTAKGKYKLQ